MRRPSANARYADDSSPSFAAKPGPAVNAGMRGVNMKPLSWPPVWTKRVRPEATEIHTSTWCAPGASS